MTDTLEHEPATERADRYSLVDLIRELRDETTLLLRQEMLLARREMQQKFDHVKRNTIAIVSGALLAGMGALVLLFAASNGLAEAFIEAGMARDVAVWLAPLLVGLIVGGGGATIALIAKNRLENEPITPEKTLESLEETGTWAREKVRNR